MHVKISSPKNYGNFGSCAALVEYLEKENIEQDLDDHKLFFNQDSDNISGFEVQHKIDNNKAKLGSEEAKFYMITVSPSQHEQQHIAKLISGRDIDSINNLTRIEKQKFEAALQDYTRKVMDTYGRNFNRNLEGKDILYFGKVEHQRKYSRLSEDVKSGLKKAGELKEGFQSHVHVVVSRKDITNKIKLSPFANARNARNNLNGNMVQIGFDRREFVKKTEKDFDQMFNYQRKVNQSFQFRYDYKREMAKIAMMPLGKAQGAYYAAKSIGNIKDPLDLLKIGFQQNPVAAKALKTITYVSNPSKLAVDVAKAGIKQIAQASTL